MGTSSLRHNRLTRVPAEPIKYIRLVTRARVHQAEPLKGYHLSIFSTHIHKKPCEAETIRAALPFGSDPGGAASTCGAGQLYMPHKLAHDDSTCDCIGGHITVAGYETQ